jgi:hypothetical protein
VDELRQIIGAPPFPWLYTPDKHNFDVEPHRMCGLDSRALLEMLQAIGRPNSGLANYSHHFRKTANGAVTEWTETPTQFAKASFSYDYHQQHTNRYGPISAMWSISVGASEVSNSVGTIGPDEHRDDSLTTIIEWSVPTDSVADAADRDWVELAGGSKVITIGGGTPGDPTAPLVEGSYKYRWSEIVSEALDCQGGPTNYDLETTWRHDTQIHTLENPNGGNDTILPFTPEFIFGPDGSVYPREYSINDFKDAYGQARTIDELIALLHPDTASEHVSVAHLRDTYGGPIGDDVGIGTRGGLSDYNAGATTNTTGYIHTRYHSQNGAGGGWLLWKEPFDSEELVGIGWPDSLKE